MVSDKAWLRATWGVARGILSPFLFFKTLVKIWLTQPYLGLKSDFSASGMR